MGAEELGEMYGTVNILERKGNQSAECSLLVLCPQIPAKVHPLTC